MRLICIIQARMASTRLPGKVLMDIGGKPMLWHVIKRVMPVLALSPIIVATPDLELYEYAKQLDVLEKTRGRIQGYLWNGNPNDVLGRYARIATEMAADGICRVTGDCPLLDPQPISGVLYLFQTLLYDYVANDHIRTWPDGMGVEVFSRAALDCADREAEKPYDREHVSPFIRRDSRNSKRNIRCPINGISDLKFSIDTQADLDFVRAIDAVGPKSYGLLDTLLAVDRVKLNGLLNEQSENIVAGA